MDLIFLNSENSVIISKSFNLSFHLLRPEVISKALASLRSWHTKIEREWKIVPLENLRKFDNKNEIKSYKGTCQALELTSPE